MPNIGFFRLTGSDDPLCAPEHPAGPRFGKIRACRRILHPALDIGPAAFNRVGVHFNPQGIGHQIGDRFSLDLPDIIGWTFTMR